ncbi:MAG TPA: TolC family protein [Bryobacteraceae bacterium]|nr:TolC family protein [Bryobacteraceae bacterium]
MHRHNWRMYAGLLFATACLAQNAHAPRSITWKEAQDEFRANNPDLLAGKVTIAEAQADETTAYLRPNPSMTLGWDQLTPYRSNPYEPVAQSYLFVSMNYLHERQHKRELRLASAQKQTAIATSAQADLERSLLFNVRDAFVRVMQAKAVVGVAKENLDYYDKVLAINKDRFDAGAIARVDFQRLELQRVQYESDLATSQVNLRTAKIDLQALLRDRTPVDQFDVTEKFEFQESLTTLEELHALALDNRPDLREAVLALEKAKNDHQLAVANGSTDPTFGIDFAHQPKPLYSYMGFSVNFPLRIFDKNQGEKLHTQLDIGRNERVRDATEVGAMRDVDSAFATLQGTLVVLRPYRSKYLKQADDVRATMSFSYEHGAASLLDFLDAQSQYRSTQLSYLNLIGACLSAANQVNFAVGSEVIR